VADELVCPLCDSVFHGIQILDWKTIQQKGRFAPAVCPHCASILLIDLQYSRLVDIEEFADVFEKVKTRPGVWDRLQAVREKILTFGDLKTPRRKSAGN